MIINYNNKSCLILERLENLGPEPHYKCIVKNENIVLAVQPSGKAVQYIETKVNNFIPVYYFANKLILKKDLDDMIVPWCGDLHRENDLPAYYDKKNDKFKQYINIL